MQRRYRFSPYFDRQDKDIRTLVKRILDAPDSALASLSGDLADPELHPHGIKEMVTSQASRMAYATVNLLRNLEVGGSNSRDRLCALSAEVAKSNPQAAKKGFEIAAGLVNNGEDAVILAWNVANSGLPLSSQVQILKPFLPQFGK